MYLDTLYDIEQHKSVKWTIRYTLSHTSVNQRCTLTKAIPYSDTKAPAWRMASRARLIMRQLGPFVDAAEVMVTGMAWNGGPPPEWDVPETSAMSHFI